MTNKVFKKTIALLLAGIMMCLAGMTTLAEELPPVTVFVDGEQVIFDVEPIIEEGRTMVPMRFIFEALDAEVEWIGETSTAVAVKGNTTIEITIGSNEMLKNGTVIELDVPAKLVDSRTLVPVRAISEAFDANVDWDDTLRKVTVTSKVPGTYKWNELSPTDMGHLIDSYGDVRYIFEQTILFENFNLYPNECAVLIEEKDPGLLDVVRDIWDNMFMDVIMEVQSLSEDFYVIAPGDSLSKEEWEAGCMEILQAASLDAESTFDVTYDVTPDGKKVLLVTFHETGGANAHLVTCKYIAIVSDGSSIRYFTAETDPLATYYYGTEIYMLCEVASTGRSTRGTMEPTKEAFLGAIDILIDGN